MQLKGSNPRLGSSLRDKDEDTLRLDLVEDEMLDFDYVGGGISENLLKVLFYDNHLFFFFFLFFKQNENKPTRP